MGIGIMSNGQGENAARLIKGLGLAACAIGLVAAGWFVGERESVDEVARLNGEVDAMINGRVESCLVEQSLDAPGESSESSESKIAVYDFGALVCNTSEQAQILMSSTSLQKRIVGRICSESL